VEYDRLLRRRCEKFRKVYTSTVKQGIIRLREILVQIVTVCVVEFKF